MGIELGNGKIFIKGVSNEWHEISDFNCDCAEIYDEYKGQIFSVCDMSSSKEGTLTFKFRFNTEMFYKLTGLYDWVYQSCPNRRVRHLMKYGKIRRVRYKNFRRALHIVGELLEE